jgi:hypothetical protein
MKKILRIYGKEVYSEGLGITLKPLGIKPDAEYDVTGLSNEEIRELKKKPKELKKLKKYG